jgi:hypothetical protein
MNEIKNFNNLRLKYEEYQQITKDFKSSLQLKVFLT